MESSIPDFAEVNMNGTERNQNIRRTIVLQDCINRITLHKQNYECTYDDALEHSTVLNTPYICDVEPTGPSSCFPFASSLSSSALSTSSSDSLFLQGLPLVVVQGLPLLATLPIPI